jgi:hypothetical protein
MDEEWYAKRLNNVAKFWQGTKLLNP